MNGLDNNSKKAEADQIIIQMGTEHTRRRRNLEADLDTQGKGRGRHRESSCLRWI